MNVYDGAHALAETIRQSEEAQDYARLKEIAEGDETNRALLSEYRRLQMKLQLQAASGLQSQAEEVQRFQQIASLLYMNSDVQAYMMAELRLQKMLADIFKILTDASGMNMDLPNA